MHAVATRSAQTDLAPRVVDSQIAAKLIGVSRRTLYRLTDEGELRRIHVGRGARWLVSDLDAFLAAGGTDATAGTARNRVTEH